MLYALCAMPSFIDQSPNDLITLIVQQTEHTAQTYASCFSTYVPFFVKQFLHERPVFYKASKTAFSEWEDPEEDLYNADV